MVSGCRLWSKHQLAPAEGPASGHCGGVAQTQTHTARTWVYGVRNGTATHATSGGVEPPHALVLIRCRTGISRQGLSQWPVATPARSSSNPTNQPTNRTTAKNTFTTWPGGTPSASTGTAQALNPGGAKPHLKLHRTPPHRPQSHLSHTPCLVVTGKGQGAGQEAVQQRTLQIDGDTHTAARMSAALNAQLRPWMMPTRRTGTTALVHPCG